MSLLPQPHKKRRQKLLLMVMVTKRGKSSIKKTSNGCRSNKLA